MIAVDMPQARELVNSLRVSAGLPKLEKTRMTHMSICTIGSPSHGAEAKKISVPGDRGVDTELRKHLSKWPTDGKMNRKRGGVQ